MTLEDAIGRIRVFAAPLVNESDHERVWNPAKAKWE